MFQLCSVPVVDLRFGVWDVGVPVRNRAGSNVIRFPSVLFRVDLAAFSVGGESRHCNSSDAGNALRLCRDRARSGAFLFLLFLTWGSRLASQELFVA